MIRPFTCICMLLAAGAGLYLYQTKHRAQMLDRQIAHQLKQIDQTRERVGVLKGEWALLNEPERLAELSHQHLALRTLAPTQFVALADLGNRLPAPLPPGAFMTPPLDEAPQALPVTGAVPGAVPGVIPGAARPAPAIATLPAASPVPKPALVAATPTRPVATPPMQLASLPQPPDQAPAPRPAARSAAAPAPASALPSVPAPVQSVAASRNALPAASPAPLPAAAPPAPRIMAPIVNVSASPMAAPARPAAAEAGARATRASAPLIVPASTSTAGVGAVGGAFNGSALGTASALGGAGRVALPAPVPYGAATAR